jgi:hypothetical protein
LGGGDELQVWLWANRPAKQPKLSSTNAACNSEITSHEILPSISQLWNSWLLGLLPSHEN